MIIIRIRFIVIIVTIVSINFSVIIITIIVIDVVTIFRHVCVSAVWAPVCKGGQA